MNVSRAIHSNRFRKFFTTPAEVSREKQIARRIELRQERILRTLDLAIGLIR
jgi:hypothetical protein